jgi:hypothetical protein
LRSNNVATRSDQAGRKEVTGIVHPITGGPTHPQWYYNLKAHAECKFGGDRFQATEVIDHDEYERLFSLAQQVNAGWSDYRGMTASAGRQIPIFRLKPR